MISIVFQFLSGGRAVGGADHHVPHLRRANIGAEVDPTSLLRQPLKILLQRLPVGREVEVLKKIGMLLVELVVGRRDRVAFAGDLRGDALCQLADRLLVDEQVHFRLAEHVNEAGRDDQAGGVNGALGRDGRVGLADESNAIADDAHIRINPGIAAAIHHAAIADERVVLLGCNRSHNCDKKGSEQKFMSWQNRLLSDSTMRAAQVHGDWTALRLLLPPFPHLTMM